MLPYKLAWRKFRQRETKLYIDIEFYWDFNDIMPKQKWILIIIFWINFVPWKREWKWNSLHITSYYWGLIFLWLSHNTSSFTILECGKLKYVKFIRFAFGYNLPIKYFEFRMKYFHWINKGARERESESQFDYHSLIFFQFSV